MGANGDEIGARLGVIVLLQADRSAVMDGGVIGHIAISRDDHSHRAAVRA